LSGLVNWGYLFIHTFLCPPPFYKLYIWKLNFVQQSSYKIPSFHVSHMYLVFRANLNPSWYLDYLSSFVMKHKWRESIVKRTQRKRETRRGTLFWSIWITHDTKYRHRSHVVDSSILFSFAIMCTDNVFWRLRLCQSFQGS
jgi:hypothetical protein